MKPSYKLDHTQNKPFCDKEVYLRSIHKTQLFMHCITVAGYATTAV